MFRNLTLLFVAVSCLTAGANGEPPAARQYYTAWTKHTSRPYYYRYYYYKAAPAASAYSYHYAIYYPSRGKRVYMYNPRSKKYWGYWDGDTYSLLPGDKQKASIEDIAAEDFPKPAGAPNIPEAEDRVPMLAPPAEFPRLEDKP